MDVSRHTGNDAIINLEGHPFDIAKLGLKNILRGRNVTAGRANSAPNRRAILAPLTLTPHENAL